MGVSAVLAGRLERAAVARPHVLVVAVPGHDLLRMRAEAAVTARGGVLASAPADADVLVVAGPAGPGLRRAADAVFAQLPGPRARVAVTGAEQLPGALDEATAVLLDRQRQRVDAAQRQPWSAPEQDAGDDGDDDGDGSGDGMEMELPGGLAMADRGADRDGLKLDVLHVPLGPILPGWPAGLVIRTELQGDVIQHAEPEIVDDAHPGQAGPPVGAALRPLDALAGLLEVAGWPHAAAQARTLRDALLAGAAPETLAPRLAGLGRRLRRSRTLRLRGDGLAVLEPVGGWPGSEGDVTARWRRWLAAAEAAVAGEPMPAGPLPDRRLPSSAQRARTACDLIVGLDLAAARLVIASLDLGPDGPRVPGAAAAITAGTR